MSLYGELRAYFDPELRRAKARAAALAVEKERRERQAAIEAEQSLLLEHPAVLAWEDSMALWGEALRPGAEMTANDCYWFRKGLEAAVAKFRDEVNMSGGGTE